MAESHITGLLGIASERLYAGCQQLQFKGSVLILLRYVDPFNATFRRMGDIPAAF